MLTKCWNGLISRESPLPRLSTRSQSTAGDLSPTGCNFSLWHHPDGGTPGWSHCDGLCCLWKPRSYILQTCCCSSQSRDVAGSQEQQEEGSFSSLPLPKFKSASAWWNLISKRAKGMQFLLFPYLKFRGRWKGTRGASWQFPSCFGVPFPIII